MPKTEPFEKHIAEIKERFHDKYIEGGVGTAIIIYP
jgi:hypothetical protein